MIKKREQSISIELTTYLVLIILCVSCVITLLNYHHNRSRAMGDLEKKADEHILSLVRTLEAPLWDFDVENVRSIGRSYSQNEFIVGIKIYTSFGDILYNEKKSDYAQLIHRSSDIIHDDEILGGVMIDLSSRYYEETYKQFLLFEIISMLIIIFVVTSITGIILTRLLKRPLSSLTNGIVKIAEGDYEYRFEDIRYRELRKIATTFTHMGRQIHSREVSLNTINEKLKEEIHERSLLEETLRDSEERYKAVFEQANDSIMIIDAANGTIIESNKSGYEALEYTGDEFKGMSISAFELIQDPNAIAVHINKIIETGSDFFETRHRTKTGKVLDALVSMRAISIQGRMCILAIYRYITELKQSQEERRALELKFQQAQKLESLGVLAGGIAHDFNNLLMSILGNADLSLMEISDDSPARDNIENIVKASHRAAELSKQMLAYSGKGHFVVQAVDISEIIKEMTHLLKVSISKKAELVFNFDRDKMLIQADATQLRQVIMNLIINASEAIGNQDGVITVSTGATELTEKDISDTLTHDDLEKGTYVYLEVMDTGCGMDDSTMAKLFDPFFTTKFTGRGLGLSAVQGIVRGHRGMLKVSSKPGQGTIFRVLFPISQHLPQVQPAQPINNSSLSKTMSGTIMLVDDEETVLSVGRKMLEKAGFDVLTAMNGHEAIKIYKIMHSELLCVLLDLTMPHMDGKETYKELRKIHKMVPVIICSGYNEHDVVSQFSNNGFAGFIQKPYRYNKLITTIDRVIKNQTIS